ncbi:hypothetical protein D9615_008522 [Tricholomella constricta]|uniref:Uncharacterized protein n=1 Tax=Tricholomella constricta TaxID=117010 RepID=A0A8H5H3S8_9AGAR|nr:hypothetical protein D9615_008522 [Tricholomella constricta]
MLLPRPLSIPQEIISTILNELSSDTDSLKRCSLVSQSFLPHCHKLLFSYICLDHPTRSRGLYDLITNNTTFIPYIRKVDIISIAGSSSRDRDCVIFEDTLAPLLQTLRNLHAFSLREQGWRNLLWSKLPADLRSTILNLTVTSITLENLRNVPMGHFGRFVCLKNLRLVDMEWDCEIPLELEPLGASFSSPQGPTGYLESLGIVDSAMCGRHLITTLTDPRSSLKLSRLKELDLSGNHGNHGFAGTIMEAAGQSLQRVVWFDFGEEINPHPNPFTRVPSSFSALPALRFLTIHTQFACGRACDPLPPLAQALAGATPRDACALEHLKIDIDFYCISNDVDIIDKYALWPALDQALARPGVYTELKRVEISLMCDDCREAFAGLSKRRMPMLVEKGVFY